MRTAVLAAGADLSATGVAKIGLEGRWIIMGSLYRKRARGGKAGLMVS